MKIRILQSSHWTKRDKYWRQGDSQDSVAINMRNNKA